MTENDLLFSSTHEWAWIQGTECTIGISRYAVDQLTDLVYIELPAVGKALNMGEQFGVVESVKAVSELYSPVAGEVIAVNSAVADNPAILSEDPYNSGWLLKVKLNASPDTSHLKTKLDYDAMTASGH